MAALWRVYIILAESSLGVECGVCENSALQTLVECVEFDAQQWELRDTVGRTLSLLTMIDAFAGVYENTLAQIRYFENVMEIK